MAGGLEITLESKQKYVADFLQILQLLYKLKTLNIIDYKYNEYQKHSSISQEYRIKTKYGIFKRGENLHASGSCRGDHSGSVLISAETVIIYLQLTNSFITKLSEAFKKDTGSPISKQNLPSLTHLSVTLLFLPSVSFGIEIKRATFAKNFLDSNLENVKNLVEKEIKPILEDIFNAEFRLTTAKP